MPDVKLIVGLGNPGTEYAGTRHNVGFATLDALAERLKVDFDREARTKFQGLLLDVRMDDKHGGGKCLLLKPMTYMNRSGDAVQQAARFYKVEPADVLVLTDEMQLAAGTFKLSRKGSHGGHNGLRDVQQKLATPEYPRLRLGVDRPPAGHDQADYVLGKPSPEQRERMHDAAGKAAAACLTWYRDGIEQAMNRHNVKPPKPKREAPPKPKLDLANSPFANRSLIDSPADVPAPTTPPDDPAADDA